jgi:hypothetical protein
MRISGGGQCPRANSQEEEGAAIPDTLASASLSVTAWAKRSDYPAATLALVGVGADREIAVMREPTRRLNVEIAPAREDGGQA